MKMQAAQATLRQSACARSPSPPAWMQAAQATLRQSKRKSYSDAVAARMQAAQATLRQRSTSPRPAGGHDDASRTGYAEAKIQRDGTYYQTLPMQAAQATLRQRLRIHPSGELYRSMQAAQATLRQRLLLWG